MLTWLRRRRGRGWPSNEAPARINVFVGNPLARDEVAAIDATSSLGLVGRSGVKRIGLAAGSMASGYAFSGYFHQVHSPSVFGSSTNLRRNPQTALPNTGTPVSGAGSVMALLARLPVAAR